MLVEMTSTFTSRPDAVSRAQEMPETLLAVSALVRSVESFACATGTGSSATSARAAGASAARKRNAAKEARTFARELPLGRLVV